jgi:hypothetical protein
VVSGSAMTPISVHVRIEEARLLLKISPNPMALGIPKCGHIMGYQFGLPDVFNVGSSSLVHIM